MKLKNNLIKILSIISVLSFISMGTFNYEVAKAEDCEWDNTCASDPYSNYNTVYNQNSGSSIFDQPGNTITSDPTGCVGCGSAPSSPTYSYPTDDVINSVAMETCGDGSYVTKGSCLWCPTLSKTTAAGNCPASQSSPVVYTQGYSNYGTPVGQAINYGTGYTYTVQQQQPTQSYQMTNWGAQNTYSGGSGVRQVYAPTVQQPVTPTTPSAPYQMTNWNTTTNYTGGSGVRQVYAPTVQQPVTPTTPSAPYQMTNWNTTNTYTGGSGVRQVYAPTAPQPVQQQQQTAPYQMTNWNTTNTYTGGSGVRQVYAPTAPQPVQQQQQTQTYQMTDWNAGAGSYSGGSGVRQVYAQTCQQYYTLQNNQCVQTQKVCQNGTVINVVDTCYKTCPGVNTKVPENQTCPNQTQTCWNGAVIPVSQTCPAQTKTCLNGSVVSINQSCTKTCPNGAVISETSVCPVDTKTCLNGSVVSINQSCTKTCPNGAVVGESQVCPMNYTHKVVTTQPSEITTSSCRFNGIATIAGGIGTIGYFEYGTSQSLGQNTNQANIGNQPSISYSNTATGLKSGTVYYYRAVITNSNGTYKGDLQSCRTSLPQTTTTKVATPVITKITTSKVVNTAKKPVVVCQDISGNTNELAAGEKFVNIELTRVGDATPGEMVEYRVAYKNKSMLDLQNAHIKISIPKELEYIDSVGRVEGTDVLVDLGNIKAGEQGVKSFKFRVKKDVPLGTSVISSAFVYYEMYDKDHNLVSDENSAYMVSTVSVASKSSSGGVSTETWYSLLLKWLVILILFILLIFLGRTIYKQIMTRRHARRILSAH